AARTLSADRAGLSGGARRSSSCQRECAGLATGDLRASAGHQHRGDRRRPALVGAQGPAPCRQAGAVGTRAMTTALLMAAVLGTILLALGVTLGTMIGWLVRLGMR